MAFGLSTLTTHFPDLNVKINGKNSFEILGDIYVNATWGGFTVAESFTIQIVAENFPTLPPLCYELSHKNTTYHINPEKDLCLGSPRILYEKIEANPDIIFFINRFVIPFFFSFRYHQKHGKSPFGELAHGGDGILPRYREIFKTSDLAICILLTYGTKFLYRGHHFCPCGSGLTLRKCHGPKLRALFENYPPELLLTDLNNCATSLGTRERQKKRFTHRHDKAKKALKSFIKGRGRV